MFETLEKSSKPSVFSKHTSRCGKSQLVVVVMVEVLFAVSPPPSSPRSPSVTLNSPEVLEHFQTKAPCYPACTDGLPTPNLLQKTKEDSNRKSKTEKCTPRPPPTPIIIPPSQRDGEGRVQQVCLSVSGTRFVFVKAAQQHPHDADLYI